MSEDLLARLQAHNARRDSEDPDLFEQVVAPAVPVQRVPLVESGRHRPITNLLRLRFEFCSSWSDAVNNQTWLGAEEMESLWSDDAMQGHLDTQREYWEDHVLTVVGAARLTLFGFDPDEGDATYLIWPAAASVEEPSIVVYSGHNRTEYADLRAYLQWVLGA